MNEDQTLWNTAIRASQSGILICDARAPDHPIIFVNPAFESMTGYSAAEVVGRNCRFLQGTDRDQPAVGAIREALQNDRPVDTVIRNYRKDGTLFWNELRIAPVHAPSGGITHFIGIQTDVTEKKRLEEALIHRVTHDELTGLPNRTLLVQRLRSMIEDANASSKSISLLFVGLEDLKLINEAYGHVVGDGVLRETALRMNSCLQPHEFMARFAGNEFMIAAPDDSSHARAEELQAALSAAIQTPHMLEGQQIFPTASIGISFFPEHAAEDDALVRAAGTALNEARRSGKNMVRRFSHAHGTGLTEQFDIVAGLREALRDSRLELHFQPQIDLLRRRVVGLEALARWHDPVHGDLPPSRFIPIAEQAGLMREISRWTLRQACRQLRAWRDAGVYDGSVAVNISPLQFRQEDLVKVISRLLEAYELPASALELELAETTVMESSEEVRHQLAALSKLGVKVSIDGFGTGYSSFVHLKQLKIDKLKIDLSFVRNLVTSSSDRAITQAMVTVARALNMSVVGMGVSTYEQAEILLSLGCTTVQGWLFSKALTPAEIEEFLTKPRTF